MADMNAIRARQADPTMLERAGQVVDQISDRMNLPQQNALAKRAVKAASPRAKVILLRQLADNIGRATAGLVPCKSGCNHCCHMATLVGPQEAAQIARDTGAPLSSPKLSGIPDMSHNGTPCPFLVSNGCSIYASRPFACRIHYSVDTDNLLCEIVPGETIRSPSMNVNEYDLVYVGAFAGDDPMRMGFADIRAFFPHGRGK